MLSERMIQNFSNLVSIDSISRSEEKVHDYLKKKFRDLKLKVTEDNSKIKTSLGANNLIATLEGTSEKEPLFFSCHTDTVSPGEGIEVVEEDGKLFSKGDTILGADDKAGIAIIIEAIQQIQEQGIPHGKVEFVFSPGEEIGLIGSSALKMDMLTATNGYVLDSGGVVGRVTIASPTLYMYDVTISGVAAHAGIEPEKGISAISILADALQNIQIGRLDETTTANIGVIQGGESTNVVLDHMLIKGEVRSVDPQKANILIQEVSNYFRQAAKKHGGSVTIEIKRMATGFHINDDENVMKTFLKSAKNLGLEVVREVSGGGSDANSFNEKGKKAVNLSIGYEKIHTTDEYIPVEEMKKAVQLVIEIIKNSPNKME
ncbi:M20/M25/M40 family metallo-hydrolase [Enterococcus innesii]|uniref:M20/M25/M40 family metallo-hydrolase n=1 Tax=Enterococcus innesii TaxID=2839759 RepID=UPI003B5ADD98